MKGVEGRLGRVFVLRLEDGDRIPDCIEAFAERNGIRSALCALVGGAARGRVVVGPEVADARPIHPMVHRFDAVHEAAAVGMLFPTEDGKPRLHMHAALGRGGEVRTGCVRQGVDIWQLAEVVILEIEGAPMVRRRDETTGFEVLVPSAPGEAEG